MATVFMACNPNICAISINASESSPELKKGNRAVKIHNKQTPF